MTTAVKFRPMNLFHQRYCRSAAWAEQVETNILPWVLGDLRLGPELLEVGPGFGATTRVLARRSDDVRRITALELDPALASGLADRVGSPVVSVVHGDGTAMPFDAAQFDSAVCFTMLHHIPSAELQDRLFAEVARVLRPGGLFAGCDSRPSARFRLIHLGDTMTLVDPGTLGERLAAAGFVDVAVAAVPGRVRWRARTAA